MMSVHNDTLQSLQEALAYVQGDTSKGRSVQVEIPDFDFLTKYDMLHDTDKQLINIMIDKLLVAAAVR